ncbi:hypothetical protein DSM21852_01440 [Methylocystis bryophila]|nr:hypothetical protein DSM21852_01440 [Methylocystis bryophila]
MVFTHEADAEITPLIIDKEKPGGGKNEDDGSPHGAEGPQQVVRLRYPPQQKGQEGDSA